jgi:hypothetical protein
MPNVKGSLINLLLWYLEIRGIGHTSKELATLHRNRPHFIGISHTTFDINIKMHLFID